MGASEVHDIESIPLAQLTTLRTGAAPERMREASTTAELVDVLRDTWSGREPWFVLGGGSNLFVGDEPFEGTVIRVRTEGIEELPSPTPVASASGRRPATGGTPSSPTPSSTGTRGSRP